MSSAPAAGHPVEHDRERRPAVRRRAQHRPRHGVGVAGRRRHEQPEVGGGEQLAGQLAVGLDDGVEVGRVEQRQALGDGSFGDEVQPAGLAAGAGRPRQRRQDPLVGEPALVVRVVGEDRGSRRRPQDAARAHHGADEGVHQRRLARAGRASDDREERRVELGEARARRSRRAGRRRRRARHRAGRGRGRRRAGAGDAARPSRSRSATTPDSNASR